MGSERRRVTVDAALAGADGGVAVVAVRGREEVSRAFRYEVDLEAREIAIEEIRGSAASLAIEDHRGRVRHLSGVVAGIEVLASDEGELNRYRIHLVPRAQLLSWRHGFRIFQERSVPEIVKAVFADAGIDGSYLRLGLRASYPKRAYCVQYDETEWQLVCRLLEEEGIWFTFEHGPDGHVLALADASGDAPEAEPASIPFVADPALHGEALRAWGLVSRSRVSAAKAVLDDYDFERPSADLRAEADAGDGHAAWFEYPARATAPADVKRLARTRLEELRSRRRTIRFATDALELQPGRRVEIADHPSASGEYFVTAVALHVRLREEASPGPLGEAGPEEAWAEVEAVPADQPFRPARLTPRPRVAGPQTARVTGPAGEEIHCDAHGRVKLQFHWDREGALDEKSSCWVRVLQPHSTGAVMIPRIGWEVVVDFLGGDPDRPVCMGRVYNPLFPPPYDLPAQKTVTAHRSNSSPGAGGANELRFDDAAGAQKVFLNAQRDLALTAAEKKKVRVGKTHKRTVAARNAEEVSASETVSVTGNQSASVGGAQRVQAGSRSVKVGGNLTEEVKGSSQLTVGGAEMIQVGNPVEALVQLAATEAINQAAALAGAAAGNAAQALVAPLKPALDAAKKAAGSLPKLGGPAGALLGGGDPAAALGASDAAKEALSKAEPEEVAKTVSDAVTGAAAAVAPEAVRAATEALGGGSGGKGAGTAGLTVGGDLAETVGAVQVLSAVGGMTIAVGGSSTETVGAARIEIAGKGRAETTGGSKTETVGGAHMVIAGKGIALDAGGNMAVTVGGAMVQKIGGDRALSAEGAVTVACSLLKLKAGDKITLKCGGSEVVLSGSGIAVKSAMVTLSGGTIKLPKPAIGPG